MIQCHILFSNSCNDLLIFTSVYVKGRGTVVTGRVEQGTVKVGEEVEILGLTKVHMEFKCVLSYHIHEFFYFMVYVFVFISLLCAE